MGLWFYGFVAVSLLGLKHIKDFRRVMVKKNASGISFDSARAKAYMGPFESEMTLREATLILGVRESAGKDKILAAHKKLMLLNHPDNGGSTYIATKVNEAKELIVSHL